jgi:uncharacterized protein (DUF3820 family)
MSAQKLRTELTLAMENDDMTTDEMLTFIDKFIANEQQQYKQNVQEGRITFGKYKGFTIPELLATEKGADYLQWLRKQTWFTNDKFGSLIEAIDAQNIPEKKNQKFVPKTKSFQVKK